MGKLRLFLINATHVGTHLLFVLLLLLVIIPHDIDLTIVLVAWLFAVLPDIDTSTSFIGRLFLPISKKLETLWGHRQQTHSLLALAVVTLVTSPLLFLPHPWGSFLWPAAIIGYASHLALDLLNPGAVPLFWPLEVRARILGGKIEQHSTGEKVLLVVLAALVVAAFVVQGVGPTQLLHFALPVPAMAQELYREWEGRYRVYAEVSGIWQDESHAREENVTFEVLRLDGEVFTMHDRRTGRVLTAGTVGDVDFYVQKIRLVRGEPVLALPIFNPTPTPHLITVKIANVYDPSEILVEAGDDVSAGQLIADLRTHRLLETTPTPAPVAHASPTPVGVPPLDIARAEAELRLAEANYRRAIATPTVNPIVVATLAPQATIWAQYVTDREETLYREPPGSERAWVARAELEQNGPQATAIAYRLDAAMCPPGPDTSAVNVARSQLDLAQVRYRAAIATPTPVSWPTPTPGPSHSLPVDPTYIHSMVTGQVVHVNIASVSGNKATIEVIIAVEAEPAAGDGQPVATVGALTATVDHVVDGDTLTILWPDGNVATVRLVGVDTPETVNPDEGVECYGPEASDYTKSLLPPGTRISLEYDRERTDRHGRTLAYVYTGDGQMVNALLLQHGYARVLIIHPNNAHAARFRALEEQARAQERGLWKACR
jgi:endonuclease YncB( thermonuclease family)/membrane-bound metal-dependent hydrolase YbcI (DUF457 family)